MKESTAVEVIAHEYAHNWEFNPAGANLNPLLTSKDIPHDGKLISEGLAQWLSFKICDHLSLVDEAETIKLWVDDEYGEGFDFINWLEEDVCGYGGVLEFVKTGSLTDRQGRQRVFGELYREFLART